MRTLMLLLCVLWSAAALAAIEVREFDSSLQKQRYDSLNGSLRCPKCENQAIGDSESPIAGDMRERVYQLLQDGRSDIEIQNYMTERFGDFVLYNPRLTGRTWLLWGLPAALVLLGIVVIALIVRARRRASNHALSAAERERLDALVNRERTQ
nr:cytochrome c-type biogenesis protein [uncultured Halomonas sp.]